MRSFLFGIVAVLCTAVSAFAQCPLPTIPPPTVPDGLSPAEEACYDTFIASELAAWYQLSATWQQCGCNAACQALAVKTYRNAVQAATIQLQNCLASVEPETCIEMPPAIPATPTFPQLPPNTPPHVLTCLDQFLRDYWLLQAEYLLRWYSCGCDTVCWQDTYDWLISEMEEAVRRFLNCTGLFTEQEIEDIIDQWLFDTFGVVGNG